MANKSKKSTKKTETSSKVQEALAIEFLKNTHTNLSHAPWAVKNLAKKLRLPTKEVQEEVLRLFKKATEEIFSKNFEEGCGGH